MAEDTIEPLVTECPSCHTRFRVTEAQLSLAGGRVRCGACLMVFTGTDNLVFDTDEFLDGTREEADAALDALLSELTRKDAAEEEWVTGPDSETETGRDPGVEMAAVEEEDNDPDAAAGETSRLSPDEAAEGGSVEVIEEMALAVPDPLAASEPGKDKTAKGSKDEDEPPPVSGDEAAPPVDFSLPQLKLDAEELVTSQFRARRRTRWWVPVAIVVGLLALTAQVLWFQYDVWIQDPGMRPVYERVCPVVGCRLPVLKDVARFYSKELVVRSHPSAADALMVDALIVNDAPFEQPFPVIELRFSALGGQLVAARRFKPEEYLAGELEGANVIRPQTPVHVTLEIQDPGPEAVSYVMVFR